MTSVKNQNEVVTFGDLCVFSYFFKPGKDFCTNNIQGNSGFDYIGFTVLFTL